MLRLDTSRNQLLIANTQIAVCSAAVAAGGFIASAFGMNLHNHHEDDKWTWYYVTALSVFLMMGLVFLALFSLRITGVIPTEK